VFCFIMGAEDLGFGKVTDVAPGKLTIEYFDSPSMRHLREASTSAIVKKILGPNTRVYLYDAASANWDVGRVLFDDGDAVEVRLSGRYDVVVPHERVFVRWKRPISDPVEFLSCGIAETPLSRPAGGYWWNFRTAFVRSRAQPPSNQRRPKSLD
jgi:ATP-dependent helicase HepA